MSKRHTTKSRRRARANVLEVRVMSPRIAWFSFLKLAGKLTKVACVLAVLAGIGQSCQLTPFRSVSAMAAGGPQLPAA